MTRDVCLWLYSLRTWGCSENKDEGNGGGEDVGWLVGCFGFNGPLRQYFSLYRAVPKREGERGEKGQPPSAPTASAAGPYPTIIQIVGRPGTGSLPSTIAPPDHP